MNEIGWVECVNCREKRAEVDTLETEKTVSSGNHSAASSRLLFAGPCGVSPCARVPWYTAKAQGDLCALWSSFLGSSLLHPIASGRLRLPEL